MQTLKQKRPENLIPIIYIYESVLFGKYEFERGMTKCNRALQAMQNKRETHLFWNKPQIVT